MQMTKSSKLAYHLPTHLDDVFGDEGAQDLQSNTKLAVFIDDAEDPDTAAAFGNVVDKIPEPDFIHLAGALFVLG